MTGLARVLRRRGSLQEAEAVFTEAMSLWRHGSQSGSVASNAAELADVLRARGEPERAEPLLREALRIRREQKGGDHPAVAAVLADLGDLLEGDGRHREALEVRREALSVRSRSLGPGHPDVGESLTDVASSCFHTGAAAEADSLFRAALGCFEAVAGREHAEVAEVHVGLGDVARARGNLDEAARHYGDALGVARGAYGPHHREITDTLVRMAGLAWLRDAPDEAVGPLREASRSWEHSRRLVGSAVHRATFQDSPDLLLAAALLESGRPDDAWIPMERYHGRILGDLLRAGGEAPAEPAAAPAARVAETLRPDEAMIGWVEVRPAPGRGSHWAWTLRRDGTVRWDRLPELPAGDPGADVAHRLRDALELAGSWPFRIARDPRLERAARELAAARFHSPARRLEGVTRLVVIPSGAMLGIPVELLPLAGEAVAGATVGERFAVSYAPSATVHAWLRERGARAAPGAALIVGDPPPGEGLPALPAAAREVEEVSRRMAGSRVLSGEAATEGALRDLAARDELRDFGTLHFATHALVDELRPERSALALSTHGGPDALQAALTGDPLEDGRLCAWEIVRDLRLDADLVTLSGCGTGLGKRVAGEGYLGFVHAFLQAGARSLVLSLWKVEDEATALFMDRFYAKLAEGASRVDALRDARRWLRDFRDDSGQQVYRHPAYWAAFVLVGEPG
jgi:tetratricopeptide (TPR) repeat protein